MTLLSRLGRQVTDHCRRWVLVATLLGACGDDGGAVPADAAPGATPDASAADGSTCQQPGPVSYSAPGCGVDARPICPAATPALDACAALSFYCGCDGKTTVEGGCNWSWQPYLYAGPCRDAGAGD